MVWYDLNREFAPFVEALIGDVDGHGLKQVILGTLKTGLSIFQGPTLRCVCSWKHRSRRTVPNLSSSTCPAKSGMPEVPC